MERDAGETWVHIKLKVNLKREQLMTSGVCTWFQTELVCLSLKFSQTEVNWGRKIIFGKTFKV